MISNLKIFFRKNTFLIVLTTVCFYSCNNLRNRAYNDFLKNKSLFDKEFVNHFPPELDRDYESNYSHSNEFDNFRLTLIHKIDEDSIVSLKNKYRLESKAQYLASDSCLLIVNRFMNYENFGYLKIKEEHHKDINKPCYSELLPIPNFWHNRYTTDSTDCKLPPDCEIYVIDAKKGKFKEKELLSKRRDMPEEWKHGASYGVAISEKKAIIIYWTVMW